MPEGTTSAKPYERSYKDIWLYTVEQGMLPGYHYRALFTIPLYAAFAVTRYGRAHSSVPRLLDVLAYGPFLGAPNLLTPFPPAQKTPLAVL